MTTMAAPVPRSRFGVLLVLLLAGLPGFILLLQSTLTQRTSALAQAQRDARVVTQAVQNRQTQMLQNATALLTLLAEHEAVRADGPRCEAYLAQLQRRLSGYAVLGTVTPPGLVTCNSLRDYRFYDVADRPYVRTGLDAGQPSHGDYQIGRMTGKPTLNLAHPIRAADGRMRGLVYAAIELGWISQVAPLALLPPGAEVTLSNHRDMVLLHLPAGSPPPGHPYAEGAAIRARLHGRVQGEWWARDDKGTLRWYTVQRLSPNGNTSSSVAYLTISQTKAAMLAEANRQTRRQILILGVLLALLGGVFWRCFDRLGL